MEETRADIKEFYYNKLDSEDSFLETPIGLNPVALTWMMMF